MKKRLTLMVILALGMLVLPAYADEGAPAPAAAAPAGHMSSGDYVENMKHDLLRGLKNVVGAPLEIPITIQEYHEKAGRPVIRHLAGLIDGTFKMVVRFGSGAWDLLAALIPDHQEGMPVNPETRF